MPARQFRLQTVQVYSEMSRIRAELSLQRQATDRHYNQLRQRFDEFDGAANLELQAAVEENRFKSHALALILDRLAIFMDRTTRHAEATDQRISAAFVLTPFRGSSAPQSFLTSRGIGGGK